MTSTPAEPKQARNPAHVLPPSSFPIANTTDPTPSEAFSSRLDLLALLGRKLVKSLKKNRREHVCRKQQFMAAFERVMAVYSECICLLEMEGGTMVNTDAGTWRKLLRPSVEYLTEPEPHEAIRAIHLYNITCSFRSVVTDLTLQQRELVSHERSA